MLIWQGANVALKNGLSVVRRSQYQCYIKHCNRLLFSLSSLLRVNINYSDHFIDLHSELYVLCIITPLENVHKVYNVQYVLYINMRLSA